MSYKTQTINPQEFCILSIISYSGNVLESKSRLKILIYLSDIEIGDKYDIYSYGKGNVGPEPKNMNKDINSLSNKEIITVSTLRTFGGNKKYKYYINKSYFNFISNIVEKESEDIEKLYNKIEKTCDEYGDIPISNLMDIVRKNHPEYFKNNTHAWY